MTSNSWQEFRQKAARQPKRILLADGEDPRAVEAAVQLSAQKIAHPVLAGRQDVIQSLWQRRGGSGTAPCMDPAQLSSREQASLLEELANRPKYKALSESEIQQRLLDPLIFGCLRLKRGDVDGFIGGATRTTTDTLRAVLSVIGLSDTAHTLFGFFLIERQVERSLILFADCAVIPEPSAKQLAHIGIGAAEAFQFLVGDTPRVAFLSFSTAGSAEHALVHKVREAVQRVHREAPALCAEGEWQGDTALDLLSAQMKGVGHSPMAGRANVLIAPDLNCGNIGYKLVQRLGGCRAVGPVLWGAALPANDLSRGCSADDMVDLAALTSVQAQGREIP